MATKTYNYINGGVAGSVDVTVTINACNILFSDQGSGDTQSGVLTIDVILSQALPFELQLKFLVTNEIMDSFNTSSSTYNKFLAVPQNVTAHSFTDQACYEETADPYYRETSEYEFSEQSGTQEEGSVLVATVQSITPATCFGLATGAISIATSGGTGAYSFAWSVGTANTAFRGSLPAGTYSVTVSDAAGNQVFLSGIVVSQPTQLVLNPTVTPPACFGGVGAVATAPAGGTGGYTFVWGDGSTAQNRTNLPAGSYPVTVRDSSGCNRLFTVVISQPTQILITVNKTGKNISNQITGGTPAYSFLWSDGAVVRDRTNLTNGVYSFTVTDANGCQQSTVIVIQDFKFYFSKNPIWLQLAVDSMIGKDNLSYVCEVFLEEVYQSDSFIKKYESEHPAKQDGSTSFNVQQVLNAFLESQAPLYADPQVRQVSSAFKRFFLRYYQKYGTPPVPDATTTNDTFYVLFGGLSDQEFAKQTFFDSYLDITQPFLTWQPITQPIASDQHAYLHLVVNNPIYSALSLKATIRYSDNTAVDQVVKSVNTVAPFEVYRFPAGIQQLGLQSLNPSKIITSYDLQVFSAEVVLSEKRTYEVYATKKHFKKLLFLNSLGAWDHTLCFGRGKQSLRTSEESISRALPVGFAYSDREEETVSKLGTLTGQLVIATLNGYQRKHLTELAISEQVFEQTASGYLPVRVRFDFDPEDDFENLDEIGLDITYPTLRRYTPEL
jgi:hypothetical protein